VCSYARKNKVISLPAFVWISMKRSIKAREQPSPSSHFTHSNPSSSFWRDPSISISPEAFFSVPVFSRFHGESSHFEKTLREDNKWYFLPLRREFTEVFLFGIGPKTPRGGVLCGPDFFLKKDFKKKTNTKMDFEIGDLHIWTIAARGGGAVFKNRPPTGRFFFFLFFFWFFGRKDLVVNKKITERSLGKTARPGGGFFRKTARPGGGFDEYRPARGRFFPWPLYKPSCSYEILIRPREIPEKRREGWERKKQRSSCSLIGRHPQVIRYH
jgi:hypothetical protein